MCSLILTALVSGQTDGNPWGWDRQRRCDNDGYDPPCGLCEGVGGRVWSDKNSDIEITKCIPVSNSTDLPKEVQEDYPKLPLKFTQHKHSEVMITDKTNPTCVGGFPGPDSTKSHCYQRQEGAFIYDSENSRLKMNLNVHMPTHLNQTSNITHVKENMWIVNDLTVTKQCICTQPGASFGIDIYPLNFDFMNPKTHPVRFIGRENMFIEYVEKMMIVDHWTQGPHHIWKDVNTKQILRMWQPWNGLEIWHPEGWDFSDNSAEFEVPPNQCKAKFGKFTIKCDKNGYPVSAAKHSFLA